MKRKQTTPAQPSMDDQQLLRYSRQIMLPEIDLQGQLRLAESRVLLIGLGGLGSPAAIYLATAGVGEMVLADADRVELSNLQRQILHRTADVGARKTDSARAHLEQLNPEVRLRPISRRFPDPELESEVGRADVVIDATDSFASRFAINRVCRKLNTPLVYGAAIRFEGQLSVFDPRDECCPCYHCLYDATHEDTRETCDAIGVAAPLLGIVGALQAMEALKVLLGIGQPLRGRLLLVDALRMDLQIVRLPRDPGCLVCGTGEADAKNLKEQDQAPGQHTAQ